MAESRADRRAARRPTAVSEFGRDAEAALDLLELLELAWHDCYGEGTPSERVVEDVFVVAAGSMAGLARAARLAVEDDRDLRLSADASRN